jgi:hypothetical protein
MRISGLTLAAIVLLSSVSFAQHGAPSSPPPPPSTAPTPAPSPAPTPAPPPAPSPAPSATVVHSAPSSPAPASIPASHIAPVVSAVPSPVSSPRSTESNEARTAPVVHNPESDSGRVMPQQKVSDEGKITPALRIGEKPPEKDREGKPAESNLRRPICNGENCQETAKKPETPQPGLRRPLCQKEVCPCPAGQTAVKGGCVAIPVYNQCQSGELWNGSSCFPSQAQCASINASLQTSIAELRSVRAQVQQACSQNSSSTECEDARIREKQTVDRYRQVLNGADPACRGGWTEDPL